MEMHVKLSLFVSLCMSFYGIELYIIKTNSFYPLRSLGIAYHYALKRLLGLPKYFSNHYACFQIYLV